MSDRNRETAALWALAYLAWVAVGLGATSWGDFAAWAAIPPALAALASLGCLWIALTDPPQRRHPVTEPGRA